MSAKTCLIVFAQALLIQCSLSQCVGRGPAPGYGLGYDGLGYGGGCGCGGVASTGGGFPITSFSPIAPTGLTIVSENCIEGALAVVGEVPFLGAVALEGVLPTCGAGTISYGCGDGVVGITSEGGPITTGIVAPAAYGPGPGYGPGPAFGPGPAYGPGLGFGPGPYGAGLGYNGCGCGF